MRVINRLCLDLKGAAAEAESDAISTERRSLQNAFTQQERSQSTTVMNVLAASVYLVFAISCHLMEIK